MSYPKLFYSESDSSEESNEDILYKHSNNHQISILSTLKQMIELQKQANDKIEQLTTKVDQQTVELTKLRSEVALMNARAGGVIRITKNVLPMEPFTTMQELCQFEESLKDEKVFKDFVAELLLSGEKTFDKFIRTSWRSLIIDEVARQCSWRGTGSKNSVRGLYITLGIRTAFKQKFALEDSDFDNTTKKFFQYAQDRLLKSTSKKYKV